MKRRRKGDLRLGYFILVTFSSIYTFYFLALITFYFGEPIEALFIGIIFMALSLPFFYWATYYFAVRDEREALKHGVVLTKDTLSLWGFEIPVDRISRVDVKEYGITSHYLAIEYSYQGRKRVKTRTSLLRGTSTEDIMELCNKIRELKGWPKQE
ncbi:MAG: hypothetical protein ACXABY_30305, partial [Candidatus Thorarchaeota archaeon]